MYHHGSGGRNVIFVGHKAQSIMPDNIAYSEEERGKRSPTNQTLAHQLGLFGDALQIKYGLQLAQGSQSTNIIDEYNSKLRVSWYVKGRDGDIP